MTPKEYQLAVLRVDLPRGGYELRALPRISDNESLRLLHASLGLTTETAEIADALKRHMMYGKPFDRTNLIEEVGDVLWYTAILLDELGATFEDAMEANIRKLKARYPDGFSEASALNRNLDAEKLALENKR